MSEIYIQNYKSPLGELLIGIYKDEVCLLDWTHRKMRSSIDGRLQKALEATYLTKNHALHSEVIKQLEAYFDQSLTIFDLPLKLVGTTFQQQVWTQLQAIPFGKTQSYLQLSRKLENEKAIRAVASANGANAISIVVPCHRIIGKNGDLVGYAGGLSAKKKLLLLEGSLGGEQLSLF